MIVLEIKGKDIEIERGDSIEVTFSFDSDPPEDGTAVLFAVADSSGPVIQKTLEVEDGAFLLSLDSSETDIREWIYTYGLYVEYGDRNGYAPLAQHQFRVKPSEAFPGAVII